MGPVSRLATGILDVFGLRTLGKHPRDVADFIQPTYDITLLQYFERITWGGYWQLNGVAAAPNTIAFTLGGPTTLTYSDSRDAIVPDGELWLVTNWQAYLTLEGPSAWMDQPIYGYTYVAGTRFRPFPLQNPILGAIGKVIGEGNPTPITTYESTPYNPEIAQWITAVGHTPFIMPGGAVPVMLMQGDGAHNLDAGDSQFMTFHFDYIPIRV